jgi:flavorubredoxin
MECYSVFDDLQLFSSYLGFINLAFNQYLLLGDEPILIHTGSIEQATELLPRLKDNLGNRKLSYIFVSHFESDECGGLSLIKDSFPTAKIICSQITARQLMGFGLATDVISKAPGDHLETDDYKLSFISYPSEIHLWEGLIAFEENRGLLFSSDLFIRPGISDGTIVRSNWKEEIAGISLQQMPSPTALQSLQQTLLDLPVKFIIPGHGSCLKV